MPPAVAGYYAVLAVLLCLLKLTLLFLLIIDTVLNLGDEKNHLIETVLLMFEKKRKTS